MVVYLGNLITNRAKFLAMECLEAWPLTCFYPVSSGLNFPSIMNERGHGNNFLWTLLIHLGCTVFWEGWPQNYGKCEFYMCSKYPHSLEKFALPSFYLWIKCRKRFLKNAHYSGPRKIHHGAICFQVYPYFPLVGLTQNCTYDDNIDTGWAKGGQAPSTQLIITHPGIQRGRARSTSKEEVVEEKELLTRRGRLRGRRLDLGQRMGLRNLKTWEGLPDYSWEDPPLKTSTIPFAWWE